MNLAPLSAAMILGVPVKPGIASRPATGFGAVLDAELALGVPAVEGVEGVGTDELGGIGVDTPDDAGGQGATAGAAVLPQAMALPAAFAPQTGSTALQGAAVGGAGIFGYGRAGIFNPGERARMAQLIAAAAPTLAATATYPGSVAPASDLPANNYKDLLAGLAKEFDVPESFITAVMFAESGGNPNAVGDNGYSVGLFQLHDQGMGHGMGDDRYDPEKNARVGAAGLAVGWRAGEERGLQGEELVRFAYDHRFNPGGGWKIQGDRVVSYWKKIEGIGTIDPTGTAFSPGALMWPVAGGHVTQEAHAGHMAADIGVVTGTPVVAVAAGTVVEVERLETGYGWFVTVDHGGGWTTRYAHASRIDVNVGDYVAAGQQVMLSGNTGKSTGPHLHFELLKDDERLDPFVFLRAR